ncbi:Origin recognition complex subunit 3 [Lasiodiplodia theobromae]|uniref:Origin recognition complex subunit 3 n=1 Tax=Lasiodiplodia theobromae TaxID=45133 RepID=UPI0015C3EDF4|nr:Origin recognition complex subunit 3 [Lasiodiplodia theobromae]KAF4535182.1 Origin recognition complex subunit 3 [Lasiodiplodia theobromae]
MEHEKCYVFKPNDERPSKRRRVSAATNNASLELRKKTCRELWDAQQERIDRIVEHVHRATLTDIIDYIKTAALDRHGTSKIPTGLVVAGPSIASHAQFFDSLAQRTAGEADSAFVALTSSECPNLKTLLKHLIRKATSAEDDDGDELVAPRRKGPKLLNYDLQLLLDWCKERNPAHVVVTFRDSEAFEGPLLADAIQLLSSWQDRIPFVLLFGVATSVEGFQEKLPSAAIRCLEGRKFDVAQADEVLEQVFLKTIDGGAPLWLGPELSRQAFDRHKDHIQSVETFVDALKYAYMSHFFANPLSIFLQAELEYGQICSDEIEALRNVDSFRRLTEYLLDERDAATVRSLLESDEFLFDYAKEQITATQEKIQSIVHACQILKDLRGTIPRLSPMPVSALYIRAASGELNKSPLIRDFLLAVKKAPSDILSNLLAVLVKSSAKDKRVAKIQTDLNELVASTGATGQPLRSAHDVRHDTMRTTVVAQKVELSKHKSALSATDTAYSKIVEELHGWLVDYFENVLVQPQDLFLHEVVIYDLRSPHRDVFTPKPRIAVERALSAPHDYLGCSCCETAKGAEGALSSTQPPTAILYQLYLESGNLINVNDLWLAFNAIVGEEGEDQSMTMALFQRSLAELKYLGLVKASRKKTDHVAKLAWKGL